MEFVPQEASGRKIDGKIIDVNIWAIGQGLDGTDAEALFDQYCERMAAAGLPLWRATTGIRTLHPQWSGYMYVWYRGKNELVAETFEHSDQVSPAFANSPFAFLINCATVGGPTSLRRRLDGAGVALDYPILGELQAQGATDYYAAIHVFGVRGDPSQGSGVVFSFTTDREGGFTDDDLFFLQATLPALSLAMKSHASHNIARSLLCAYLGEDAGRRVHSGEIVRGSVETLRAVLWFADIRGFTKAADTLSGAELIDLLDDMLECMTAPVRAHGGQVLKFLGDGLLATFPIDPSDPGAACAAGLDAAVEAMKALEALNATRKAAGKPTAVYDLALHSGDLLYGNIGAVDRLDFTVIGPAVNEVSRIEALCETLGQPVLVSAELAEMADDGDKRLRPLGKFALRGVREPRDVFALDLV